MIRYIDRNLEPLTQAEWRRLFGNQDYRVIDYAEVAGLRIECAWVGVWLSGEPVSKVFCVDTIVASIGKRNKLPPTRWYHTERQAREAYLRLVEELA